MMPETRSGFIDQAIWTAIVAKAKSLDTLEQINEFNTLVRLLEFNTRNSATINSGGLK